MLGCKGRDVLDPIRVFSFIHSGEERRARAGWKIGTTFVDNVPFFEKPNQGLLMTLVFVVLVDKIPPLHINPLGVPTVILLSKIPVNFFFILQTVVNSYFPLFPSFCSNIGKRNIGLLLPLIPGVTMVNYPNSVQMGAICFCTVKCPPTPPFSGCHK